MASNVELLKALKQLKSCLGELTNLLINFDRIATNLYQEVDGLRSEMLKGELQSRQPSRATANLEGSLHGATGSTLESGSNALDQTTTEQLEEEASGRLISDSTKLLHPDLE